MIIQWFILSSLTRNYSGANPSLLSEQNLWPHMLCSGQHQTFNCVWVKKTTGTRCPTLPYDFWWLGWAEQIRISFSHAAEMSFVFLCVFVLFLSKGSCLMTLLSFPVSKKNYLTSGSVRGKGFTSQIAVTCVLACTLNDRDLRLFPCIKSKWFLEM